jgi:hypothetical protein
MKKFIVARTLNKYLDYCKENQLNPTECFYFSSKRKLEKSRKEMTEGVETIIL